VNLDIRVPRERLEDVLFRLEDLVGALRSLLETPQPEPAKAGNDADGPVIFLEPRRQFIISQPSERQIADMNELAHLEYSDERGNYSFVVRQQDLWRVSDFKRVREVIERWAPGHPLFLEWAEQAWDKRNVYSIVDAPDGGDYIAFRARTEDELTTMLQRQKVRQHIYQVNTRVGHAAVRVINGRRHALKRVVLTAGYPVTDLAGLQEGETIRIRLKDFVKADERWREYQSGYVEQAYRLGASVLVAPPGAGKTVASLGLIEKCQASTLIITPQRELAEQWRREIADKTDWAEGRVGMFHGDEKRITPITVATYHSAVNYRELFDRPWGLVIFDECHHLPAQFFRRAATFQSIRRLGLTASPVREDALERDIWALIGPPIGNDWARLFAGGYVARPEVELWKVDFPSDHYRGLYRRAGGIEAQLIAAQNPAKVELLRRLLRRHHADPAVIFVEWIDHGQDLSQQLDVPFIYGETSHIERERLYQEFRDGKRRALIVSRVGNQGLDLPDASLAIMLSWHGGSRQEGTQRTGRVMRPKEQARAIYIVTRGTSEEDFARRQVQLLRQQGVRVRERGATA